jgi:hypothetical protein
MENSPPNYPLLQSLLAQKGLRLLGTYTLRDLARIFGVSIRAMQERINRGELSVRDLPGRAKCLSEDLESFLQNSKRSEREKK